MYLSWRNFLSYFCMQAACIFFVMTDLNRNYKNADRSISSHLNFKKRINTSRFKTEIISMVFTFKTALLIYERIVLQVRTEKLQSTSYTVVSSVLHVFFKFVKLHEIFFIFYGHLCSLFFVLLPKKCWKPSLFQHDFAFTHREGLSVKHVDLYNLRPCSVYSN